MLQPIDRSPKPLDFNKSLPFDIDIAMLHFLWGLDQRQELCSSATFNMTPALIVADMSVGENFHLQWQDFETNAVSAFKSLLTDKDLLDVTLVSEDDLVMEAHAVVLHSSSNFFRRVLCQQTNSALSYFASSGARLQKTEAANCLFKRNQRSSIAGTGNAFFF